MLPLWEDLGRNFSDGRKGRGKNAPQKSNGMDNTGILGNFPFPKKEQTRSASTLGRFGKEFLSWEKREWDKCPSKIQLHRRLDMDNAGILEDFSFPKERASWECFHFGKEFLTWEKGRGKIAPQKSNCTPGWTQIRPEFRLWSRSSEEKKAELSTGVKNKAQSPEREQDEPMEWRNQEWDGLTPT